MVIEIPLFINSNQAQVGGKTHDFTVKLSPSLRLDETKKWSIALDRFEGLYKWNNVDEKNGYF